MDENDGRDAISRAEDRDRQQMAYALHESVLQQIAAARIHLVLAGSDRSLPAETANHVADALRRLDVAMAETARLVNDLRPRALDLLGLEAAVDQLATRCSADGQLLVEVEGPPDASALDALEGRIASCAYRMVLECLDNTRQHACATFAHVRMQFDDAGDFVLDIADDGMGTGAADHDKPDALALKAMAARVASLGGTLLVARGTGPAQRPGTRVTARWPRSAAVQDQGRQRG